MSRIDEIRARCDAATPEPWKEEPNLGGVPCVISKKVAIACTYKESVDSWLNADFIAHARDDIPYLLSEIDRLTAELETLRAENARLRHVQSELESVEIDRAAALSKLGLE